MTGPIPAHGTRGQHRADPDVSTLPDEVVAQFAGRPADPLLNEWSMPGAVDGDTWLAGLPWTVAEVCRAWELVPAGPLRFGACAVVHPVQRAEGPAVLKLTWPHLEAATEHFALRHWSGVGAVRLLRADPTRWALLLEPLDADRDLHGIPIEPACQIVGGLLRDLRVPAPPTVPPLGRYAARAAAAFDRALATGPSTVPRRFLEQAKALADDLGQDLAAPGAPAVLLHTDLHYANVLAGTRDGRAPWLAIDPKPMSGDPAVEIAPLLSNRADELGTGSTVRESLRRRLEIVCEAAQVDPDRARGWTIVREMDNLLDLWVDPGTTSRRSLAVAIIKAMQP